MENYDYLCSGITVEGVVDSMVSTSPTKSCPKIFVSQYLFVYLHCLTMAEWRNW